MFLHNRRGNVNVEEGLQHPPLHENPGGSWMRAPDPDEPKPIHLRTRQDAKLN